VSAQLKTEIWIKNVLLFVVYIPFPVSGALSFSRVPEYFGHKPPFSQNPTAEDENFQASTEVLIKQQTAILLLDKPIPSSL
jgi:hypothetical protein